MRLTVSQFLLTALPALLWLAVLSGLSAAVHAQAVDPPPVSLYDKDPNHLWNRVYSALMIRSPEPDAVINDLLDPPYWGRSTRYLLDGDANIRAVAVLGELVKGPPAPTAMSPWQRAVMQRDLLGIFQWLAGFDRTDPHATTAAYRDLSGALVPAIRHVALSAEEIRKLPDNYALAVTAPGAVTAFNAAQPAPFLPKDLLVEDGPWIALARKGDDGIAATIHFKFFGGRSIFEVRMKHPEGRAAGEAYLKQLADMKDPLFKEIPVQPVPNGSGDPPPGPWLNPETPQFPPGTMWALVRRAILADTKGMPVVSPLVESAQLRVYGTLDSQTFFEWETRHALLLGNGGFHLTKPKDLAYGLFPHGSEDAATGKVSFLPPESEGGVNGQTIGMLCIVCHTTPGIFSINSRSPLWQGPSDDRGPEFRAVSRARMDEITAAKAESRLAWMLLRSLWENPARPGAGNDSPRAKAD